ncbi:unnamed protein product [Diabrotica balteata]|uniref:Reverse transcriptase domain-containing protein n=1 Tax=Diabrotica balteata TaxID=107213 RepID=A0A9N9XH44_DIABA|nr:unnamed protein product [Diabrotica balteata]
MERAMLNISFRDKIPNTEIRRRTKVTDIMGKTATLRWQWVAHVARQATNRCSHKLTFWRPLKTKGSMNRGKKILLLAKQCTNQEDDKENLTYLSNNENIQLECKFADSFVAPNVILESHGTPIENISEVVYSASNAEISLNNLEQEVPSSVTEDINLITPNTYVGNGMIHAGESLGETNRLQVLHGNDDGDVNTMRSSKGDTNDLDMNDLSYDPTLDLANDTENDSEEGTEKIEHKNDGPVSGNDTEQEEIDSQNRRKTTRKRKSNPKLWKTNIAKAKRLKGEEYVGFKENVKAAKVMGIPCNCRKLCHTKLDANERFQIFQTFWKKTYSWEQRHQFLAQSVNIRPKDRQRSRNGSQLGRRNFTYSYVFNINNKNIEICKVMFLNTLSISEKVVRGAVIKKLQSPGGLISSPGEPISARKLDEEKKRTVMEHINLFPRVESHYSRSHSKRQYLSPELNIAVMYKLYTDWCNEELIPKEKIVTASMYRFIFCTEFNLSFKLPNLDTCDMCDKITCSLQNENDENLRKTIENAKKIHLDDAETRYGLKRVDKERAKKEGSNERVVMIDLQKCLPTPLLTNAKSFYLRQLWTFNFTIHDNTAGENHCMIWNETISERGGNQIASCLFKWIQTLPNNIKEITLWSDNCAGQNRNTMLFAMYLYVVQKFPHLVINHKFLLTGHTHMEVDAVHAVIEKKKKRLSTMSIQTPREWAQFILWVVPKKLDASGKQKWRIVIDYRKLNKLTIQDRYPLPQILELLDQLEKFQYFTTLDFSSAFHKIKIDTKDIQKTAFSIENGHYEFCRMSFGLMNAPSTFLLYWNWQKSGVQDIIEITTTLKWNWAGHLARTQNGRVKYPQSKRSLETFHATLSENIRATQAENLKDNPFTILPYAS